MDDDELIHQACAEIGEAIVRARSKPSAISATTNPPIFENYNICHTPIVFSPSSAFQKLTDKVWSQFRLSKRNNTVERISYASVRNNVDEFRKIYVEGSVPVIITGMLDQWPAMSKWRDREYLSTQMGERLVTIALTPNGWADAVTRVPKEMVQQEGTNGEDKTLFVQPAEQRMTVGGFLSKLLDTGESEYWPNSDYQAVKSIVQDVRTPVYYAQFQNSSLSKEYQPLQEDILSNVYEFGCEAFGTQCGLDAQNMWIGDARATTSLHQDWYENLYGVVVGTKSFVLIPPWEAAYFQKKMFRNARYIYEQGKFSVVLEEPNLQSHDTPDNERKNNQDNDDDEDADMEPMIQIPGMTPWIPVDPTDPKLSQEANPNFQYAHCVRFEVHAGEVLYMPALWLHHIHQINDPQTRTVIAVNWWYDMDFESKMYGFISKLQIPPCI